ncbi:uncharacterized protein LOC113004427 [Solenopsis invicta]|uniref:uncharacterized protein LOC113004427 n=1 Tax=Solenopsis invicta TaxID=13686 RepID=UPI00193DF846|nr:uncharacterized protein LOC113004427 [Solenopsis invicta]
MENVPPVGRGKRYSPYDKETNKLNKGRSKKRITSLSEKVIEIMDEEVNTSDSDEQHAEPRSQLENIDLVKKIILGEDQQVVSAMECTEHSNIGIDQSQGERAPVQSSSNTRINKSRVTRSDEDQPNTQITKSESYFVINGNLTEADFLDKAMQDSLLGINIKRLDSSIKGDCNILIKVIDDDKSKFMNKNKNRTKILVWCNKNQIFPADLFMQRFNLASLTFKNVKNANDCLDKLDRLKDKWLAGIVDRRKVTCRGVIADWPYDIPELWNNILDRDDILKFERMKRRVWDKTEGKFKIVNTDNIIVTMKGARIRNKLTICDNLRIHLRIRPYIERVTQCFNCFLFGHIKAFCKNKVKCVVCGENAHGQCNKPLCCRNCQEEHKSTFRKCPVFLKNKEIKVIMSYNNISFTEAVRLIKGDSDERFSRVYDRYTKPDVWPELKKVAENKNPKQIKETVSTLPYRPFVSTKDSYSDKIKARDLNKSKEEKKIAVNRKAYSDYYKNFNPRGYTFLQGPRGVAYPAHDNSLVENLCNQGNSTTNDRESGTFDIDRVIECTINKCKISKDFNRELVELIYKYRLPHESPLGNKSAQADYQKEYDIERYRVNIEEHREEWRRAKSLGLESKRAYWDNRNEREGDIHSIL